jgi:putative heme-binding domain-containing protein
VAPADPYRSVLYYRMAKVGSGRMPHIGSEIVDERGVRLIHDWIRQLPLHTEEEALLDRLRSLEESAALARERDEAEERIEREAEARARAAGRDSPNDEDREKARQKDAARAPARVKARAAARAEAINRLLSGTTKALILARAVDGDGLPAAVRSEVLAAAVAHPESQVRDLFERFLPDEQRVKRLGAVFKPEQILALKGDAARGKELFFKSGGLQCVNCHRIAGTGSALGPELTQVGKKYDRAQILEKILDPSKKINPEYVTHLAETTDGRVLTGLLAKKTAEEVVLKTAGDKEERIPAAKLERLVPLPKSLMPDLLLRDATAEQAADLLEYLGSLK